MKEIENIDWDTIYPEINKILVSPGYYLLGAQHNYDMKIRDLLVDFNLTRTQFDILIRLEVLTKTKNVVTQMDFADFFKFDKMLVSKVLRTLEKKGFVIRENHPYDHRAKSLVLTNKGHVTVDDVLKYVVKFNDEFFSVLDNPDEFVRQLKKLI